MSKDLKVIDLYSGVGGLSLGAVRSGFNLIGAVEKDQKIVESHKKNFPTSTHISDDVALLTGKSLKSTVKLGGGELAGIIGGPPCQGFSTMGRRKLTDKRNSLFTDFYRLVSEMQPAFYLAENVPGILNDKYSKLRNASNKLIEDNYDTLKPIKVVAKDFGAATTRTRIFFIGVRKDVKGADSIPAEIERMKSKESTVVRAALAGLPVNISDDCIEYSDSWRTLTVTNPNPYLSFINRLVKDVGDEESVTSFVNQRMVSSCFGTRHTEDVVERFSNLQPGQQDSVSKAVKLKGDGFCPTLRAGTDNTKGSYQSVRPIHHLRPRVITP